MIAAYLPTKQTWYFTGKQIYDENFAIYDYVIRNYRFVGIFGTAEGAPVDVYERNESADDSRLLLIAALQYRMKTKAEIQKYTDDIDRLTRPATPHAATGSKGEREMNSDTIRKKRDTINREIKHLEYDIEQLQNSLRDLQTMCSHEHKRYTYQDKYWYCQDCFAEGENTPATNANESAGGKDE